MTLYKATSAGRVPMTPEEEAAHLASITPNLEDRRQTIIAAARAKYFAAANGGTTLDIGGGVTVPVATMERPVLMLERSVARMARLEAADMPVVTTAGQPVSLTPALANAMLAAVEDHIAACEARQHEIVAAALAAEDHDDLDDVEAGLDTGWPSNTQEPE